MASGKLPFLRRMRLVSMAAAILLPMSATGALALSEIPKEEVPEQPPITVVPLPPPVSNPGNAAPDGDDATTPALDAQPGGDEPAGEDEAGPAEVPEVLRDLSVLPAPVRATHDRLVEICRQGDIEALRPLIATGEDGTMLGFGDGDEDPIAFLKSLSGDGQGYEILAILEEVLSAGFVHLEEGSEGEMYVWPYFFAVPLDSLKGPQMVELFKLVTAGDYEDMKSYGAYIFYRVGITPAGKWAFFLAGD